MMVIYQHNEVSTTSINSLIRFEIACVLPTVLIECIERERVNSSNHLYTSNYFGMSMMK